MQTLPPQNVSNSAKPQHKGFRRPILDILTDLSKPVPARFISTRRQGGTEIKYISWVNICKLLEYFCPGYEWEIDIHYGGDRIYVVGKLTIWAEEGAFSRSATGNELSSLDKFGDPSSNAEAMAIRRAACKFGLGRQLWQK